MFMRLEFYILLFNIFLRMNFFYLLEEDKNIKLQ